MAVLERSKYLVQGRTLPIKLLPQTLQVATKSAQRAGQCLPFFQYPITTTHALMHTYSNTHTSADIAQDE